MPDSGFESPLEDVVLAGKGVTKRFRGVKALDAVDFDIRRGEIFGLIGPNGAGKTTLMNVISGVLRPDAGQIMLGERDITGLAPHEVTHCGVARSFQVMRPFTGMTVRENVAIGARFGKHSGARGMADALGKADEVLEWTGLQHRARLEVTQLTTGERKKLELCRALAMDPVLLLLDEVMAGLNQVEIGEVMELIRRVNATGVTVALIEHLMKAVMGLSDRILVLQNGTHISLGTPREVSNDPAVIEAYLGHRYAHRETGRPLDTEGGQP